MKKIVFTKTHTINNITYKKGDVILVGSSLADLLLQTVAKLYTVKKKDK